MSSRSRCRYRRKPFLRITSNAILNDLLVVQQTTNTQGRSERGIRENSVYPGDCCSSDSYRLQGGLTHSCYKQEKRGDKRRTSKRLRRPQTDQRRKDENRRTLNSKSPCGLILPTLRRCTAQIAFAPSSTSRHHKHHVWTVLSDWMESPGVEASLLSRYVLCSYVFPSYLPPSLLSWPSMPYGRTASFVVY